MRAALAMSRVSHDRVVDPEFRARLARVVDLEPRLLTSFTDPHDLRALASVEVLVTGWGAPELTPEVVAAAPRLRAVVHTAGSVRAHVSDAVWDRGIVVSSAAAANAVPVAEYTLAMVLLAGKGVLPDRREPMGNNGSTVGILSASLVGRRVLELLEPFDLRVLCHDPYVPVAQLRALGAEPVGLAELAERSDVFSVHTPLLPETRGLVDAGILGRLRDGATILNTARGAVVDRQALTAELVAGRLRAILDVTDPEPLPADDPLWNLPNVLLTPHVAGSLGNELRRLTATAAAEVESFVAGHPFRHPVQNPALSRTA